MFLALPPLCACSVHNFTPALLSVISPLGSLFFVLSLPPASLLLWPLWLSPSCLCSSVILFYFSSPFHDLLCSPCPPLTLVIFLASQAFPMITLLGFSLISLPSLAFSTLFRTQKTLKGSEINFSLDKHPNL